jgi:hypothetical protein
MTILDDDIAIFRLAIETDDRTRTERAALTRTAKRLTRKWNTRAIGGFGKPSLAERRKRGRIDLLAEMNGEGVALEWWPDDEEQPA